MRRAAKVDDNQAAIVRGLRGRGVWVWSTAALGGGFPDLLCWWRGAYTLLEVKRLAPPSAARLTDAEALFFAGCPGARSVVRSLEEALAAVGYTAVRR